MRPTRFSWRECPPKSYVRTEDTIPSKPGVKTTSGFAYSREMILLALKGDNPNITHSRPEPLPNEDGWTEIEDNQLEFTVKHVAKWKGTCVPRYVQLSKCFKDGEFSISGFAWQCGFRPAMLLPATAATTKRMDRALHDLRWEADETLTPTLGLSSTGRKIFMVDTKSRQRRNRAGKPSDLLSPVKMRCSSQR
jgi:hypothetical protein